MISIVDVTIGIIVIDLAVTGHSFIIEVVHIVLYSAAEYAHGDLLIRYAIDIVALSAYLLLIGFRSTITS